MSTRSSTWRRNVTVALATLSFAAGSAVAGVPHATAAPATRTMTVEVWNDVGTTLLHTYTTDATTEAFSRFAVAAGGWNDWGSNQGRVSVDDLSVLFADGRQANHDFASAPTINESTTGGGNDALQYDAAAQELVAVSDSGYGCETNYETVAIGDDVRSIEFSVRRLTGWVGDGSYWDIYAGLAPSDSEPILSPSCVAATPTGYVDNLVGVRISGDGDGIRSAVGGWVDGAESSSPLGMAVGTKYVVRVSFGTPPATPPAAGFESFETVTAATTYHGSGARRDCGAGQGDSCSVRIDPPCCGGSGHSHTNVNADLSGPTDVSFWFLGESTGGNVDSAATIRLDAGSVVLDVTDTGTERNNGLSLSSTGFPSVSLFGSWSPANQWHEARLRFDPATKRVTVTAAGASTSIAYDPLATKILGVEFGAVRWHWDGSPYRYDNLRVVGPGAPNDPPVATLVAPAAGGRLAYPLRHEFTIRATDAERDRWSARILVRRKNTGSIVHDIATAVADNGATIVQQSPARLEPGEYEWSVVATDQYGATAPETPRRRFTVDPLSAADGWYVALGDSYASGEGAPVETAETLWIDTFEYPTDEGEGVNECHRSGNAYARLVEHDEGMPANMTFAACSGAETRNLWNDWQYTQEPFEEQPQFGWLNFRTKLVTMSIGGNDANFGPIVKNCVLQPGDCQSRHEQTVARRFARLDAEPEAVSPLADQHGDGDLAKVQPLATVYSKLRAAAPHARVLIVGYPRFFPANGHDDNCSYITPSDQDWMNRKVTELNDVIERRAVQAGFEFVDVESVLAGHELCTDDPWINHATGDMYLVYAFHPNHKGHNAEAQVVRAKIQGRRPATITQNSALTTRLDVPAGTAALSATVRWPAGDVPVALRSPSGRVVSRSTTAPDVRRSTGSTHDAVTVTNPEPGAWYTEYLGSDVLDGGMEIDVATTAHPLTNRAPTAAFTSTYDGISTIAANASGSTDPDNRIVDYLWDWGDGSSSRGATATHTYVPGTYTATLVVRDEAGAMASRQATFTIRGYTFTGYTKLSAPPAFNRVGSGRAVTLRYRITTYSGTAVSDPASFRYFGLTQVRCDGTPSTGIEVETVYSSTKPVHKGDGWWEYAWTPPKSLAGTCQRATMRLADRGVTGRSVLFDVR